MLSLWSSFEFVYGDISIYWSSFVSILMSACSSANAITGTCLNPNVGYVNCYGRAGDGMGG